MERKTKLVSNQNFLTPTNVANRFPTENLRKAKNKITAPYDLGGKAVPWVAISIHKNYLKTNLISVMVYFIVGFMAQCHYSARDIRSTTRVVNS